MPTRRACARCCAARISSRSRSSPSRRTCISTCSPSPGSHDRLAHSCLRDRVRLGVVYHMPFWRAADGTLRELEGSFARYVDWLAPYFDEISLCVPVLARADREGTEGTAVRAPNVTLAPLPAFAGPLQFYP